MIDPSAVMVTCSLLFDTGPETELPTEAIPAETMQRLLSIEEHIEDTERPGFNTLREKLVSMTPSSAGGNGNNSDLKRAVNEELEARDGVVDYEITESSPEHVLVTVTETTEDGGSRGVLYRIQHEPKPDGTDDIHWEYLGPVADEEPE